MHEYTIYGLEEVLKESSGLGNHMFPSIYGEERIPDLRAMFRLIMLTPTT